MATKLSLERAGRAWCFKSTENIVMDTRLAEAFAEILDGHDGFNLNLKDDLTRLLNVYSRENESNTPDFILAAYLMKCLEAFEMASTWREQMKGCG